MGPERLDRVSDRSMADNLPALRAGQIEAVQLFEPFVEEALASQIGHLWYAASSRGRTTYTAFVTTREHLIGKPEPLLRMVKAILRSQQWTHAQSAQEIAAAIASFFPTLDRNVLARALGRYQSQLVWGTDPVLSEDGFDRLRGCLLSSGFIHHPVSYEACVDNAFARQVIAA